VRVVGSVGGAGEGGGGVGVVRVVGEGGAARVWLSGLSSGLECRAAPWMSHRQS